MNKKQLVCMWVGIAAIEWVGFLRIPVLWDYVVDWSGFVLWTILISLVTAGLIYTLRDKKRREGEERKPMNLRRGLRRMTLLLSIVVGLCGAYPLAVFIDDNILPLPYGSIPEELLVILCTGCICIFLVWLVYWGIWFVVKGFCDDTG